MQFVSKRISTRASTKSVDNLNITLVQVNDQQELAKFGTSGLIEEMVRTGLTYKGCSLYKATDASGKAVGLVQFQQFGFPDHFAMANIAIKSGDRSLLKAVAREAIEQALKKGCEFRFSVLNTDPGFERYSNLYQDLAQDFAGKGHMVIRKSRAEEQIFGLDKENVKHSYIHRHKIVFFLEDGSRLIRRSAKHHIKGNKFTFYPKKNLPHNAPSEASVLASKNRARPHSAVCVIQ